MNQPWLAGIAALIKENKPYLIGAAIFLCITVVIVIGFMVLIPA